eukprot:TRINITY_DN24603_c0_g1_i1.p1 TRINITY_DN24603_c0_g1~~TRINITY_DN24603_c0_g1_i1.p1  ORF type:complete len:325 (+),score=73.83 TRINITY_DN24603_c0_g1_i1:1016-1990(+)
MQKTQRTSSSCITFGSQTVAADIGGGEACRVDDAVCLRAAGDLLRGGAADGDAAVLCELHSSLSGGVTDAAYALLSGKPLLVVGREGTVDEPGTVRWAVRGLRQVLPVSRDAAAVVPWLVHHVHLPDLAELRLAGARSESLLAHPCKLYTAVLDLQSGTVSGARYRGKWLQELFGPKDWGSPSGFAAFLRYWLLRLTLTASTSRYQTHSEVGTPPLASPRRRPSLFCLPSSAAVAGAVAVAAAAYPRRPAGQPCLYNVPSCPVSRAQCPCDAAIVQHLCELLRGSDEILTDAAAAVAEPARRMPDDCGGAAPFPVVRLRRAEPG